MNILVITPIYPGPGIGENFTKVVHYFTKEWIKNGENVQVISTPSFFPKIMYKIPNFLKTFLQNKLSVTFPTQRNSKIEHYTIDGVPVCRIPLFKSHPKAKISLNVFKQASSDIIQILHKKGFNPDIIVGHWFDPTIYFINVLKVHYNCKASLVVHNHTFKYTKYIDGPDIWGCRKIDTAETFNRLFPSKSISFRCCSGIPSSYTIGVPHRDWIKIKNFIYVGTLIGRKYPQIIIEAILKSQVSDFRLKYIGEGGLRGTLEKQIKKYNLENKVEILGRLSRDEIVKNLDKSDVFIMVSKDEVFGLVYLEAMARGCIVIAAEKEGMEGIIKSGNNGFLIPAGDETKLIETINLINSMDITKRNEISNNAIVTAQEFTDEKVAMKYLDRLKSVSKFS